MSKKKFNLSDVKVKAKSNQTGTEMLMTLGEVSSWLDLSIKTITYYYIQEKMMIKGEWRLTLVNAKDKRYIKV